MGLLHGAITRDATLVNPPSWLKTALGVGGTASGQSVTVTSALGLVPVYSAVSLIAGTVGSLPLVVYRRNGDSRERASNHRAWRLLHTMPNPEMAADEVWELVTAHLLLWGNAFLVKEKSAFGLESLWPIDPARVQVGRDAKSRRYFTVDNKGPYFEDTILHIRGLSASGLVGYSPIQLAKQTLANALAQEQFQGKFLRDEGRPAVILRHPNQISDDAAKRLAASWDDVKSGGTAVLEEGVSVEKWTMPLEDAQFIESVQFGDLRIAQLYNLPPAKIGAKTGDSLTYATTEGNAIDFITYTLRRWLVRIENSVFRDPDIFVQGDRFFAEFLVEGLLRADSKSRAEFYAKALDKEKGWMDRPEVRARENLPTETEPEDPASPDPED